MTVFLRAGSFVIADADLRHIGDEIEGDDLIVHEFEAQAL